jgi:DNA-binding transcriptional MocR family regulator
MSIERRKKLVELANKYNFFIIADEVYQLLHFDTETSFRLPAPFSALDDDKSPHVFAVGSFSKILGPGLRVGWVIAKGSLLERMANCGLIASGGSLKYQVQLY